ncbi:hypothetical protein [Burkholderia vietnamiensis]|uniref:hypothetical protein n=1 Tax=Burkholderia vietnamiensis TaxID=60552 RepID=UPI0007531CEC|nr:hypothetical protein [Burkholderia vietnamiensis]KVE50395.1 hypothetical protein WI94_26340 [Burkholderia vietnamiensis]
MHLPHHQKMLQRAVVDGNLDQVIERIAAENPRAFHVDLGTPGADETLSTRTFYDQPARPTPMKGFIKHYVPTAEAA